MFEPVEEYVKRVILSYHRRWNNTDINHENFMDEQVFRAWCLEYSVTEWYAQIPTYKKLFSLRSKWRPEDNTPFEDHVGLFKTEQDKLIFISQPYKSLAFKDLRFVREWTKKEGLCIEYVPEFSWHCPGSTGLLMYSKR